MSRLSDTGAGALTAWRSRWCPPDFSGKVGVAYSAGADSTALLAAAVSVWPGQVVALHVHHGLQAAADGFEATAREVASRLNVPLQVGRTDARHAPGRVPKMPPGRRVTWRWQAWLARPMCRWSCWVSTPTIRPKPCCWP
ncbi:MAG: ATP-binding protein [Gammaproteobacteria bacterium]